MAKGRLPFNDLIAMAPQMEDAPFITRYVKSQPHFFLLFFGYLYVECTERYVLVVHRNTSSFGQFLSIIQTLNANLILICLMSKDGRFGQLGTS
jgi:phosphate starvation-inducible membrane PsiE